MRIVDRQTFLALPCPVVYMKIRRRWVWDDSLCIKLENWTNDWIYQSFDAPDGGALDSGDQFLVLDRMIDEGASYPIDREYVSRDGMYDDTEMFLVYEKADVEFLIETLKEANA